MAAGCSEEGDRVWGWGGGRLFNQPTNNLIISVSIKFQCVHTTSTLRAAFSVYHITIMLAS